MEILFLIGVIIFLLICLWLPAVIQLRKKKSSILNTKNLTFLLIMPVVVVVLVLGAEAVGLVNPGGLIIAFTAFISALGYLYGKFIVVQNNT